MPRLAVAALWLGSTTLALAQTAPATSPPSTPSTTPADTPEPPQTAPAPQAPVPPQAPPPPAVAPAAPSKPLFTFAFHGFAGVTLFVQDAQTKVAEGQLAMWVFPQQTGVPSEGLLREWPEAASGAPKHYGYAFQWWALSALIAILYVWFQFIAPRRKALHA